MGADFDEGARPLAYCILSCSVMATEGRFYE
jgi:hypothetical protein